MVKKLLLISSISMLFTACYYDNEEALYPVEQGTTDTSKVDTMPVSYTATIKPMIDNNCATSGCHVAGTGRTNFTTYAVTAANKDLIRQRAVVGVAGQPMPTTGLMSAENRDKLKRWIEAGALNN